VVIPIASMRYRVRLERLNAETGTWADVAPRPIVWAAPRALGEQRYEFRVRYQATLRDLKDTAPAMRLLFRGDTYDITDVRETQPLVEITIAAKGRQIDSVDLATGARRTQAWPSP